MHKPCLLILTCLLETVFYPLALFPSFFVYSIFGQILFHSNILGCWIFVAMIIDAPSYFFYIYHHIDQAWFLCINIRQVRGRCWKTEGTWRMLMHWKTMFNRYYCLKTENICYMSRYFFCTTCILFRLFTHAARTLFQWTIHVLGQGSTYLVTAAILWPRYEHIESFFWKTVSCDKQSNTLALMRIPVWASNRLFIWPKNIF